MGWTNQRQMLERRNDETSKRENLEGTEIS